MDTPQKGPSLSPDETKKEINENSTRLYGLPLPNLHHLEEYKKTLFYDLIFHLTHDLNQ